MKAEILSPTAYITVKGKTLDLKADVADPNQIDFRYKEDFREDPIALGSLNDIPDVVKSIFDEKIDMGGIEEGLDAMENLPVVGGMIGTIKDAELLLTEIVVSPKKKEYILGVGVRGSKEKPLKIGPLSVDGFSIGIRITT